MAWDNLVKCNSFNATVAIPDTANFSFVILDTTSGESGVVVATQGSAAIGVIQEGATTAGDPVPVCTPGSITKVLSGAALTDGQYVSADASGRAVPATSGAHYLGQVVQGVAAANQLAVILFQPLGAKS